MSIDTHGYKPEVLLEALWKAARKIDDRADEIPSSEEFDEVLYISPDENEWFNIGILWGKEIHIDFGTRPLDVSRYERSNPGVNAQEVIDKIFQ